MKNIRFNINLYLLVPSIFSGFSVLSLLVGYRLTRFYIAREIAPTWPLAFWGAVLVIFTFICGLVVVRFVIEPVKKFVSKTQTMGVLKENPPEDRVDIPKDELHEFSRIFDQVTEILGKVEARELFPEIVGQSAVMRRVFNQILKVAPTDATVLIFGETGTGKELIARSIHRHSQRRQKPFIAFNCAAIPEGLLESELFGHEKGAFTGAAARKLGQFELAHQGTLFLDEIGDMPLATQVKLLRTIEERTVQRLGSVTPKRIDVRFIAATHRNLQKLVSEGKFRQDLYFRLNVVTIHLPPLRRRREDIALLADRFLENIAPDKQLSQSALQRLMVHDWPGNVRELQNVIESAAVMAGPAERLDLNGVELPDSERPPFRGQHADAPDPGQSLSRSIDTMVGEYEKKILIEALFQSRGIQRQAAKILGLKERSLWHRLKKYQIEPSDYKL
jgi:transcriptional regulator with PAS, ATPase and Fis domain